MRRFGLDDAIDFRADAGEIPAIYRAEDVDGALNIVVVYGCHTGAAADRGNVIEDLGSSRASGAERQIAQRLQRLHVILGSLRDHVVADTILRIEPEGWLRLKTTAERNQQALGYVGLRYPLSAAFVRSVRMCSLGWSKVC